MLAITTKYMEKYRGDVSFHASLGGYTHPPRCRENEREYKERLHSDVNVKRIYIPAQSMYIYAEGVWSVSWAFLY